MNRSKKKSFDWYGMRQRFSIRKYHIGAASVLLGTTLVLGTGTIVGAETGVNGDGASNGQIVPVNNDGISDGTQPQGDNQGNNSSGVQTGNTTNSTANDQPAGDTGSVSSLPVGTLRSADTGTQGDGLTNQSVDESVIKFPTQDNQTPPAGYQSVLFHSSYVKLDFEGKPGEIEITRNGKPIQVVAFWVKTGTTWGTLKKDPQFRIPKYTVDDGDFILGYDRSVGQVIRPTDFDSLDDTPIVDTWEFSPTVDYIVGDVSDGKTFEAYMNSGSYAPYQILQFHGITLNANGGTVDGKAKKAFYVAYKHVQWGDELVTKKIVVPSRDGYTFVRWQTATGEGIPTSGQIETIEFTAVWLKHPTEAVKVFNPEQLSETDKTKVADLIRSVNPDLQNSIQEITVANNGDATVRFTTGEERTISGASLVSDNSAEQRAKAKESISDAVLQKQDDIAKSQLTAKEQQDKLDKLRELQESIEEQIDGATSEDALDKIVEDGKNSIENFDLTSATKKTAAKQDLETAYNAKKDEIAKSVLTAEEKAVKQAELDQAKSVADSTIDAATDNAGVDTALTNGQSAISGIDTSTSAKKEQAKQDLETAYNAKKDEIANSALTAEEKTAKQAELDKAKEDATKSIDTATTDDSVHKALTEGKSTIAAIDTTASPKKTAAKKYLEDAYNAKKAEIANSGLTAEEKTAKQAELDQAKSTADSAIDAATDDAGVAQALTDGKSAITGIDTSTSAKKDQAKEDLETAYNAKKDEIAKSALTAEEKAVKQAELDKAKEDAENAIVTATDNAGVDTALTNGQSAISGIDTSTSAKKEQAKQELKAAADDAKASIDANDNLTDAEKQAAKKAVDDEVAKANDAIDVATKAAEVETATLAGEKAVAKEELKAAADDAKKAIDANNNLTDAEKQAAKKAVDDEVAKANDAIDAATKAAEVETATLAGEKAVAKEDLEIAYNAKKNEIANSSLTAEEKAAKQAELDQVKSAADSAIDAATDYAGVAKALEDGKSAIDAINTTISAEKAAAKQALEKAYNAKKEEIANSALTAEEKAAKQAELDQVKSAADRAIDAATDDAGVAKALEDGKAAIDAINTTTSAGIDTSTSATKAQAKQDLETAYNAKKEEIANSSLTAEEKAAKQAELDQAKSTANSAIDAATDNAGVAKALEDGKAAIDAINTSTSAGIDTSTSAKKAQAKKDLEAAYNAKKAEIENSALTADEKAAKQAELDKAKADADKAIDAATDASGVAKALEAGKAAIDAINTTTSAGIDTSTSAKKAHKENKVLPKTGDNVGLSSVLGIAGLALLGTAIRKKRED
ncbi:YSIRK signal domain/LPXTG anchor domain surface protein [Streptococcus suis]|uniref:Gram-positive cocci surface proteins LPxTG domain-containing protein n=1 Tax=Streptococcus suis TaxID=1307 RepID=M1VDU6_STRSU|nr:YSIRK signal domain/LPXTG anchor domain surface protein [Streptococcus suis]APZ79122.1 Cell wall protein [Streptococcus suis]BAM94970.1 hypothetical protein [Streptococcus suis]HEM3182151.1 YSIRK signal domain/LPXTG anchor domain surface protein [Streptococcus suis 89-5259]